MSCAACQARVEKAVSRVPGVESCSVSLLTNSMGVEGSASSEDIISAVENAGYGASLKQALEEKGGSSAKRVGGISAKIAAEEDALKDRTTPLLRRRLIASLGFLIVLMYFSMGTHMFGWPVPAFMKGNHVAMGLMQLLLAGIVMVINQRFFISGFKSLFHGAPNMDTLIALGSSAAFLYSTVMLFAMTRAQTDYGTDAAMPYMNEFYFESAAMILTLITVGKMLESYSKGKTTDALKSLMKLAPKTATLLRNGSEVVVPVDEVAEGDVFVVRPGENIPVDGVVLEGISAVNEAALTGESIPADKEPGSRVSSATLNQSGFLKCRATRVGEDTTFSQIISMVSDAAATKAPVAKLADTISGYFVPAVIIIAAVTAVIWLLIGKDTGFALARGICVLVVSCPCALGLATPVAIMVGNGMGAKNGILFKTAEALQETGNIKIIALDKTGTITEGEPKVTDILPAEGVTEAELISLAAALESRSEHPLAKAVMDYAAGKNCVIRDVDGFTALPGNGLTASVSGTFEGLPETVITKSPGTDKMELVGGSLKFISSKIRLGGAQVTGLSAEENSPAGAVRAAQALANEGKTPLLFALAGHFLGIIAVADTIKDDSARAISELKNMGIRVIMLTGDNRKTAEAIGRRAGVDEVAAGVMPDGKEEIIRRLREKGRTAMVGDGINDAPALTRADIGIAIGAGTDVAIDSADVVLMKSRLTDVSAAIRLSRQTYRNILENLFWALIYNVLLIPLAAGLYTRAGLNMNPMWGAAAMSMSSFFVVSNALRLNLFNMHDPGRDRPVRNALGDEKIIDAWQDTEDAENTKGEYMTKTISIEGMMCEHCEATVKKALEKIDGVESAKVSHTEGTAVVELSGDVEDAVLRQAVEDKDYTVTGIA